MSRIEINPTILRARELARQDGHSWRELPGETMGRYFERALIEDAAEPGGFACVVGPDLTVALDESLCVVLRTPERTVTVTDVDRLRAALDEARTYARTREGVQR